MIHDRTYDDRHLPTRARHSWHARALFVVLAVACLFLGVVGLLLPILPGILFLVLAVALLSRVSPRVARWRQETPAVARIDRRIQRIARVGWGTRLKVFGWMAIAGIAGALHAATVLVERLLRRAGSEPG